MFQDMYIYCSFLASQQLSAVFHHITAATSCRHKHRHLCLLEGGQQEDTKKSNPYRLHYGAESLYSSLLTQ
jgi:hypothetical protein